MKLTAGQTDQAGAGAQQLERPDRIGVLPAERRATFTRQRLRQDEKAVHRVGEAEAGREPERQPRIDAAKQTADGGAEDEAGAERRADQAEGLRALLRRGHVGDIGERGRNARRRDAGDHPADKQPAERRRKRHQHVVEGQAEVRHQDDRPASEPVRQRAEQRREDELHQRPDRAEQPEPSGGGGRIVVEEALHQLRQHRNDDAERHHVEQHGDEDEAEGGAAGRCGRCLRRRLAACFAHLIFFRLCSNGFAFSRRMMRTGVPGRSNTSRRLLTR